MRYDVWSAFPSSASTIDRWRPRRTEILYVWLHSSDWPQFIGTLAGLMLCLLLAALDQTMLALLSRESSRNSSGFDRYPGRDSVPADVDHLHSDFREAVRHLRAKGIFPVGRDHVRCLVCIVRRGRKNGFPGHRWHEPVDRVPRLARAGRGHHVRIGIYHRR